MFDLMCRIERIGRHHYAARFEDAEISHYELWCVRHEDSHPVTLLHAHIHEPSPNVIGERVHLFVCNDRAFKDGGGAVWIFARRLFQKIEQRRIWNINCMWN